MRGSPFVASGVATNTFVLIKDLYNNLDLRAYGLDSSGSTSAIGLANTARLRQALTDATSGQTILAPAGTYYFESDFDAAQLVNGYPILRVTKHVTLAGAGQDATVFQAGPADGATGFNWFTKEAGFDFTLRNITVQGPLTNGANKQFQGMYVKASTTGGAFTVSDATLDYFTCCMKLSDGPAAIDSNAAAYILGQSTIRHRTVAAGGQGVLLTGGRNLVVVRGTPLFDAVAANPTNQQHNFYSDYMCGLDIDCAGGEFRENGGGYNVQFFGGPEGPPLVARIAGMTFTGTNLTAGILGHRFARATPGGALITELELSRLIFNNTSGIAMHAIGDWRMTDCDLSAAQAGIQAYTTGPVGIGRIFGGTIRSFVQAGTAGVASGYKWEFKGTRFRPTTGDSTHSAPVRCIVAGATIILDDTEHTGVADKTAQISVTNGKVIVRRAVLDNLNDSGQTVTITGAPTGGTFTLSFGGNTTAAINYNSSADTVRTKLQALASIGTNNVIVTPVAPTVTNTGILPATVMLVTFVGTLAGAAQATITADATLLTGGSTPAVTVASLVTGGAVTGVSAATTALVVDGSASFTNPATALAVASGSPTGTLMPFNPGGTTIGVPIASNTTVTVPFGTTVFHLTGVNAVVNIYVQGSTLMPLVVGYTISVIFDSTATMTAAGNIAVAVAALANQVKTLIWDGTKWQG